MKITEIKFTAGADASVYAVVVPEMPSVEETNELNDEWQRHGAKWPVKDIRSQVEMEVMYNQYEPTLPMPPFHIELWTGEIITVFTPNYVRWSKDKTK